MQTVSAVADYSRELRHWDGFGVAYIEAAQTPDYAIFAQDIGGLSALTEPNRQELLELVFGADGLRPGLVKLMLDPFHQPQPEPESRLDVSPHDS